MIWSDLFCSVLFSSVQFSSIHSSPVQFSSIIGIGIGICISISMGISICKSHVRRWPISAQPFMICLVFLAAFDKLIHLNELLVTMSCNIWRCCQFLTNQRPRIYLTQTHKLTKNQHTVRPCSTSRPCKNDLNSIPR